MTKLYLHFGGPKTGSSAIQNFLFDNHDSLGINYYVPDGLSLENKINSGNGLTFFNLLSGIFNLDNIEINKLKLKECLHSYIKRDMINVISSEMLYFLTIEENRLLKEMLDDLNIEYKIIIYIKDVIPFLLSAYDQHIKRHGYTETFDHFILIDKNPYVYLDIINNHHKIYGDSLLVRHYDSVNSNKIIEDFVSTMDMKIANTYSFDNISIPYKNTNRSLTINERYLLRTLNSILDPQIVTMISDDYLNNSDSYTHSEYEKIDNDLLEEIYRQYKDFIVDINCIFFNSENTLKISNEKNYTSQTVLYKYNNIYVEIRTYTILKLANILKDSFLNHVNVIFNDLLVYDNLSSQKRYTENNLDALRYIINNRDIYKKVEDPLDHYLMYGKDEGRKF